MFLLQHTHGSLYQYMQVYILSNHELDTLTFLLQRSHGSLYLCGVFYVAFNTVQVISRRVVGRAEETSTYSSLGFCTVNCRPTASNYQLSHLRPCRGSNPGLRGWRQECYHRGPPWFSVSVYLSVYLVKSLIGYTHLSPSTHTWFSVSVYASVFLVKS